MSTVIGLEDMAAGLWLTVEDLHEYMAAFTEPEGKCTVWTGQRDGRGYGVLKRRQDGEVYRVAAHRLAYAMHVAPVRTDLVVLHLCDNKRCVNPHHLVMGTQKANMYDLRQKGMAAHGSKHPKSKLTDQQVVEIRKLAGQGVRHKDIAAMYGVARSTVTKVANRAGYSRVA